MRKFLKIRALCLVLLLLWSILYLPVYFASGGIFAPLSACQIPLLPIFGVDFGYVLYALFVLCTAVLILLSLSERFSKKVWVYIPPVLLLILDVFGQILCYQALSFELNDEHRLEAYYYFNNITPVPLWFFIASIALDVLFFALLLLPLFTGRNKRRTEQEAPEEEGTITTDNWSEIFAEQAQTQDLGDKVGEEYNPECEKK